MGASGCQGLWLELLIIITSLCTAAGWSCKVTSNTSTQATSTCSYLYSSHHAATSPLRAPCRQQQTISGGWCMTSRCGVLLCQTSPVSAEGSVTVLNMIAEPFETNTAHSVSACLAAERQARVQCSLTTRCLAAGSGPLY